MNNVYFVTYNPRLVSIFHSSFLPNSDLESSSSEPLFFAVVVSPGSFRSSPSSYIKNHLLFPTCFFLDTPTPTSLTMATATTTTTTSPTSNSSTCSKTLSVDVSDLIQILQVQLPQLHHETIIYASISFTLSPCCNTLLFFSLSPPCLARPALKLELLLEQPHIFLSIYVDIPP